MVDSITENGILNPIIVLKKEDTKEEKQNQTEQYEILSGHNRVNAGRLANLKTVPCIVKENLSEEAYAYVIETI
nr:ParB N-terminal domain-containing protein [Fusobacterium necrophorum]